MMGLQLHSSYVEMAQNHVCYRHHITLKLPEQEHKHMQILKNTAEI